MEIVYEPTDRQKVFHRSSDDYIILAGSRGSGKSMCLLIEALGVAYNSHVKGHWQALILRRTIPQLQELLVRAKLLYPKIIKGIRFNSQKNTFVFPNGSFIQFASCERDEEIEQYRGREFNFIGIDELSHFDTEYCWNWLKSCNRNSHGYPNRMVGTTNPGPFWVKKMCKINDKGEDTWQKIEYIDEITGERTVKTLRFIQINIESNPYLSTDYKASLYQDELNRDAFLYGLWKSPKVPGQVLEDEMRRFDNEGRLTRIPRDFGVPVHVFTDIGYADHTCLVFVQFIGDRINIIDFYENNACSVDVYVGEITKRYGTNAIVHLPHDGAKHESNGETVRDYWEARVNLAYDSEKNGGNLPALPKSEGLNRVKLNFHNVWINDIEATKPLIEHLRMYRRRWNENLQQFGDPIHDIHSHSFDSVKYIFHYERPVLVKASNINPTRPYIPYA